MAIPLILGGIAAAIIADEIISDDVIKPKVKETKDKEYPSDSEVPDWAKDKYNSTKK